ncbi:MAG: DUF4013 domain-containing protein [Candidatus Nanoarchaeia archaeon]|nr:DUF4013 domain-containing protein [Candidatus Nanoarchaeia archaeon]
MLTLDSAYKYISKDYKETLIFCVFAAMAIFIPVIGIMLLMGLSIRIISNSINKKEKIPKVFENFGNDILNGLKYSLFIIIIMIPFCVIFASSFGVIMNATMSGNSSNMMDVMINMGNLWILAALVIIAYMLIIPALTANFAKEQKFSAFFEINKAFSIVFGNFSAYLKMILISIIYTVVLSFIAGITSFTVIVPILISPLQVLIHGNIMGTWFNEVSKK